MGENLPSRATFFAMIERLRARLFSLRDLLATMWPIILIVLAGFIVAYQFVEPAPPKHFRIACGGTDSTYYAFAQRYAKILAKNRVTLEIVPTSGSRENLKLLKSGAVDAAFVQGGTTLPRETAGAGKNDAAADEEEYDATKNFAGLRSLGSVYYEPVWLFYRDPHVKSGERHRQIERLSQLKGKNIAIGARSSGIRSLAIRLLRANEIETYNSSLNNTSSDEAAQALQQGKIDAAFVIAAPEASIVQALLRSPDVLIMNFAQAEAYTRRFPFLFKIVLPRGMVDLVRDIPSRDTMLLATTANLVANKNLHPALASLLLQATAKVHGSPGFFQNAGEFPAYLDHSIELAPEAERFYKSGPPFLQRYLPFWAALLIERMFIMLLPLIALFVPLVRIAPAIYSWRIRTRVFRCYGELKFLEKEVHERYDPAQHQNYLDRLDRLEEEANHRRVPLGFVNLVYTLREHIHLVRKQILRLKNEPEEQEEG